MTDTEQKALVEWLRSHWLTLTRDKIHQAADTIEAQAREIERYREALEKIAQPDYGYAGIIESGQPPEKHADYFYSMVSWRRITARTALEGISHD